MSRSASVTSSGDAGAVAARWLAGDRFGVLLTGDPLHAEELFRTLAPHADRAFGAAGAVTPEDLAAVAGERVVALAWDRDDVHPALLRRCTAVLDCGRAPAPPTPPARTVGATACRSADGGDAAAGVVLALHAAGVHDHALDVAAARLAAGLAADGWPDPVALVRRVVVRPRAVPRAGDGDQHPGEIAADGGGDDDGGDDDGDGGGGGGGGDDGGEVAADAADPLAGADEEAPDEDDTDPAPHTGDESGTRPGAPLDAGPSTPPAEGCDEDGPGGPDDDRRSGPRLPPPSGLHSSAPAGPEDGPDPAAPGDEAALPDDLLGDLPDDLPDDLPSGLAPAAAPGDDAAVRAVLSGRAPSAARTAPRHLPGRRGARSTSPDRGSVVRVVSLERARGRVAVVPTLRRAAERRAADVAAGVFEPPESGDGPLLRREDLRGVLRRRRGGAHTVVVLDRSSSLGASGLQRAGGAADAALSLVAARRGVVSVVVAAGARAQLVVNASRSLERARAALLGTGCGGGTPLSDALRLAVECLAPVDRDRRRVVLLTDGHPTVALSGRTAPAEVLAAELAAALEDLVAAVPDVGLVPLGPRTGTGAVRARRPFLTAGVRVVEGR